MRSLVTGGAGFIGRALVGRLLQDGHRVTVLDNLSNSFPGSLVHVFDHPGFEGLVEGDVGDSSVLSKVFTEPFDHVYHLAASIRVQDSIDNPMATFQNDAAATVTLLEACRRQFFTLNGLNWGAGFHLHQVRDRMVDRRPRVVFTSTCLVYDHANSLAGISEVHPTRPSSPYSGSKLAAENMVLSYGFAYGVPVVVARPFNTYGPYQKSNLEGGVVLVFLANVLSGRAIQIKGTGTQTRDLLFVDDCADFLARLGASDLENVVVNAGTGCDVSVNDLAAMIAGPSTAVEHIEHDHPQSEISVLRCDAALATRSLNWRPKITLDEGLRRTNEWLVNSGTIALP